MISNLLFSINIKNRILIGCIPMVLFISYKYIIVGLFVDYKCIVFTFYTSLVYKY